MAKKNTPNLGYIKCPSQKDLTGYSNISMVKMVDMEWRMKRKDSLYDSEVQVFALILDGTENTSYGTKLRFDP